MPEQFGVVVGMSIGYVCALAGLVFAWISYKKRQKK